MTRYLAWAALVGALALLGACGGPADDPPPARELTTAETLCVETERGSWREDGEGVVSSLPPEILDFNRDFVDFCDRALGKIGTPTADPYETVIDLQVLRQDFGSIRNRAADLGNKISRFLLGKVEGLTRHLSGVPVTEAPARLRALLAMTDAQRGRDPKVDGAARRALKGLETGPYAQLVALVRAWERGLGSLQSLMRGLQTLLRGLPHLFQDFRNEFRKSGPAAAKWLTESGARTIVERKISDEVYSRASIS